MSTHAQPTARDFRGLVRQLRVNLTGKDGWNWLFELQRFMRKEWCWDGYRQANKNRLRNDNVEMVIANAFALNQSHVARTLLTLLAPSLSDAEKRFVEVDEPEIILWWSAYGNQMSLGGCPEGREAGRKARDLEGKARARLSAASVSVERQSLLSLLVLDASLFEHASNVPREIKNLEYSLTTRFTTGKLHMLTELAKAVNAPEEIRAFLELCEQRMFMALRPENYAEEIEEMISGFRKS